MNGTGSRFKSSAGSRINQLDSSPHQDSQKTIAVEEVGYATADLDVVETDDLLRKKISDSEHEQQPLPTQQRKSTRATDPISSSPRLPPTRLPTEKTRSRLSSPEDNLLPSERDLRKDPHAFIIDDPMGQKKPAAFTKSAVPAGPRPFNNLQGSANGSTRSNLIKQVRKESHVGEPALKKRKLESTKGTSFASHSSQPSSPAPPTKNGWTDRPSTASQQSNGMRQSGAVRSSSPPKKAHRANIARHAVQSNEKPRESEVSGHASSTPERGVGNQQEMTGKRKGESNRPTTNGNAISNPQTIDSDSDVDANFTKAARSQRITDAHSSSDNETSNARSERPRPSRPRTTHIPERNPMPQSPEPQEKPSAQTVQMPPESPDELQTSNETDSEMNSQKARALHSPTRTLQQIEKQQRKKKTPLADLVLGRDNMPTQHLLPKTDKAVRFPLKTITTPVLIDSDGKEDYHVLTVDKGDKVLWADVKNGGLMEPLFTPIKVADIIRIHRATDHDKIIMLTFRRRHERDHSKESKMTLELSSQKDSTDLQFLLQKMDGNIDTVDKTVGWILRARAKSMLQAKELVQLRNSESDDELSVSSRPAAVTLSATSKPTQNSKRTRDLLDAPKASAAPPQKAPTVITGADRRGSDINSPYFSPKIENIRAENYSFLTDNKDTASASGTDNRAVTRSSRSTQQKKKESPPAEIIKFSKNGGLGDPWQKPLGYPPVGKKKDFVNFKDLSRLDDEEFLNDDLINFFSRYLQHQMQSHKPEVLKKTHFFNTFFLENVMKTTKKGTIDYKAISKWTKNINIFTRDYVVFPVNEHLHWYLIIVCNLPLFEKMGDAEFAPARIRKVEDDAEIEEAEADETIRATNETQESFEELSITEKSPARAKKGAKSSRKKKKGPPPRKYKKAPTIISLDSLGTPRSPTCGLVKQYIIEEAKNQHGMLLDKEQIPAMTAKLMPLQSNFSDCGLYACMYLEQFVRDPERFVRAILQREEDFGWPDTVSGTQLRDRMRNMILELHREQENEEGQHHIPEVGRILLDMREPHVEVVADSPVPENEPEPGGPVVRKKQQAIPVEDTTPPKRKAERQTTPPPKPPRTKIDTPKGDEDERLPRLSPARNTTKKRPIDSTQGMRASPERITIADDDDDVGTDSSPDRKRQRKNKSKSKSDGRKHHRHASSSCDQTQPQQQSSRQDSVSTDFLTNGGPAVDTGGLPGWSPSPDAEETTGQQEYSQESAEIQETQELQEVSDDDDEEVIPQQPLRPETRAGENEIISL